ncbi:MAG TPA: PhnA domain-containing protein [Pseudosphingobacterium sp.]|nr:PhnA domain-containing protein [Pseudosphingobacterium sp.]
MLAPRKIKNKRMEEILRSRSGNKCELCKSDTNLTVYTVPPTTAGYNDNDILICDRCLAQVDKKIELENNYWHFLSEIMWSEVTAIQVVAWRMLNRLQQESWAADSLDMLYLDDETLEWAKATGDHENTAIVTLHKDSNGNILQNGDSVVLTKSLDVKGSSLNAKLGTVVKNIKLVEDNPEQIEGRVEGQLIVILTKYLRKQHN